MKQNSYVRIISIIVVVAAAIMVGLFFFQQWRSDKGEETYQEIRKETKKETKQKAAHDFEQLQKQNADIYAWIQVPNTKVDYPVLQSEEDNFYLSRDINKQNSKPGSIYSNSCNSKDMEDAITILYGHDMKAHTMFGSLHLFDDPEFFEENETILVETPQELRTYSIYGVFNYNDNYIPSVFSVTEAQGAQDFIDSLEECAKEGDKLTHVRQGETLTADDKILVLSTCISGQDDRRFLVVAELTNRDKY